MSNFLKLVQESMPPQVLPQSNQPSLSGGKIVDTKKGGILNKVTSAAQKVSSAIDTIEKYGTGKWDINDTLQKLLSKQLDKSTDKVGLFGKSDYSQIKLGDDIITKINNYSIDADTDSGATLKRVRQSLSGMQDTLDDLPQKGDPFTNESTLNGGFLNMISEATAVLDKDGEGKFQTTAAMKGEKDERSAKLKVWDVLKSALDLPADAPATLVDPDPQMRGKKVVDRRISWITKGVPAFLNNIKEEYPDIPFTFEGHSIDDGLSISAIEQEEEEFNFRDTTRQDWIKTLGAEKAEKIVRGLVDIYPGDRIKFPDDEEDDGSNDEEDDGSNDEEDDDGQDDGQDDGGNDDDGKDDDGKDEPIKDEPIKLTSENALFELAGRTSFGVKGIQWTLKPKLDEVYDILGERGIRYLTFLLQTNDNAFRAPEGNTGIVYAYDDNNELINPITTEKTSFQWDGQQGLYTLSTDNKELMGIKYSEGQFPINKDKVMPLTDGKHILYRPDDSNVYVKFKIVQDMNDAKMYLIDKDKGVTATPEEIREAETFKGAKVA